MTARSSVARQRQRLLLPSGPRRPPLGQCQDGEDHRDGHREDYRGCRCTHEDVPLHHRITARAVEDYGESPGTWVIRPLNFGAWARRACYWLQPQT